MGGIGEAQSSSAQAVVCSAELIRRWCRSWFCYGKRTELASIRNTTVSLQQLFVVVVPQPQRWRSELFAPTLPYFTMLFSRVFSRAMDSYVQGCLSCFLVIVCLWVLFDTWSTGTFSREKVCLTAKMRRKTLLSSFLAPVWVPEAYFLSISNESDNTWRSSASVVVHTYKRRSLCIERVLLHLWAALATWPAAAACPLPAHEGIRHVTRNHDRWPFFFSFGLVFFGQDWRLKGYLVSSASCWRCLIFSTDQTMVPPNTTKISTFTRGVSHANEGIDRLLYIIYEHCKK